MIIPQEENTDVTRRCILSTLMATPLMAIEVNAQLTFSPAQAKRTVASLGDASSRQLNDILADPAFRGKLSFREVEQIAAREKRTIDQLMIDLLPLAQLHSRPPLTHFRVGSIVQGSTGNLYFGANIEVPLNVLSFSVHAEQSATANAFMNGDTGLAALAVTAAPCGHCRQFLNEFTGDHDLRIFIRKSPAIPLSALLPFPFGPKDLGLKGTPFTYPANSLISSATPDEVESAALDAARRSYAPYSKSPSGVAVRTSQGHIFPGSYLENAAFNPSLSPLQAALAGLTMAGQEFGEMTEVVLVELEGASISQLSACKSTLDALAPKASIRNVRVKIGSK